MWQFFFKHFVFPLHCLSQTPLNPKSLFSLTPSFLGKNLCKITSRYVFLNIFFHFCIKFCRFLHRFLKIWDFWKLGWGSYFCENFFKILIGLNPICRVYICVGPMRHSNHVLSQISSCSCIIHRCCSLLHVRCLTECPSDILVLYWTQMSSNTWVSFWLNMLDMFWSMSVCFTHFPTLCHAMHTLCITYCAHMHQFMHTHAQWFTSCILFLFTWLNTYSMLFCVCLLCFKLVLLCFRLFYLCFKLTWI